MVRTLVIPLLLVLAATGITPARAAELRLAPDDTTVTIGDSFTLRVVCDAVPDLKGFQSAHAYPASRLQLLSLTAGNVLTDAGGAWFATVVPDVAAPADTAWLDAAMLDGSTQGPGVVAYLRFTALLEGNAPLPCVRAEMRDSQNVSLGATCTGGVVRVVGAVRAGPKTWGRLKTLYR